MRSISVFNNKGGVGKTILSYHLAHALASLGKKTLMIDLDPQCNLTVMCMDEEELNSIWQREEPFIDDFENSKKLVTPREFAGLASGTRSVHFLLKPAEDGTSDIEGATGVFRVANNLDLIPGRLSIYLYEDKIASRWSDAYQGDPLAIRTITKIFDLCQKVAREQSYDYIIIDTSPSLGALNKVVISTTDGFVIPCVPDMFSLYGIKNIGQSLTIWKKQFDTIYNLISTEKRKRFPSDFVRFLGFTIYNARVYRGGKNKWDLAKAHYNYAMRIPDTIKDHIKPEVRDFLSEELLESPIGETSIMHSHSTLPSMAQKYKRPIWEVPSLNILEAGDRSTIIPNKLYYESIKEKYVSFAKDLLNRIALLG